MLARAFFKSLEKSKTCGKIPSVRIFCSSYIAVRHGLNRVSNLSTNAASLDKSRLPTKNINRLGSPGISLDYKIYDTFISTFPEIVKALPFEHLDRELSDASKYFESLCYYVGPNRELYATPALLNAYKALSEEKDLTPENLRLACILAWCFEMTTTSMIPIDDMLDGNDTRWGKPCLHKTVGRAVTVDVRYLHTFGFAMMKIFFKNHPRYTDLMNVFSDCMLKSAFGQDVDTHATVNYKKYRNFQWISRDQFLINIKYKNKFIMFKCPVLAAMHLTNTADEKVVLELEPILDKFSFHFQIMNDMWDCYGKYNTFGRMGTDIRQGKCTWLSSTALQCMSSKQLRLFQQHYGVDDQNSEEIIKNIYEEIKIPQKYRQQKLSMWEDLKAEQKKLSNENIQKLLGSLLDTYFDIDEDLDCNFTASTPPSY